MWKSREAAAALVLTQADLVSLLNQPGTTTQLRRSHPSPFAVHPGGDEGGRWRAHRCRRRLRNLHPIRLASHERPCAPYSPPTKHRRQRQCEDSEDPHRRPCQTGRGPAKDSQHRLADLSRCRLLHTWSAQHDFLAAQKDMGQAARAVGDLGADTGGRPGGRRERHDSEKVRQ
jgi:hypothetical protein